MTDPLPSSALREIRRHFTQPVTWLVLVGVAVLLTLLAPFDTAEVLRLAPRLGFWLTHAVLTYGLGFGIHALVAHHLAALKPLPRTTISAGLTAVSVTVCVIATNWALLGILPAPEERAATVTTIFAITLVISALIGVLARALASPDLPVAAQGPGAPAPAPPAILARLPFEKRGDLVSLSVEDHYVRVRTTQGEEIILMRLADAMRETGEGSGMQVHRSHWVAPSQVTSVARDGERAILSMSVGADIPASRRYVPAIKAAGLLPK